MAVFLANGENEFSYSELLDRINCSESYCPILKTENLQDFLCNLILALVSDKSLILLDSDIVDDATVNKPVRVEKQYFRSIEEIIEKMKISAAEITIFTSGTTGQPKKVTHQVSNLIRAVRISPEYRHQIWAFAYSPTHMAGLQVFFQAFMNSNTLVNVFNATRLTVYEAIEKYRITNISATPTFYRLLLPVEKSFEDVRRITFGGEKSNVQLYDSMKRLFPNAKINNIYASTEAGSLFAAKGENFEIPKLLSDRFKIEDGELLIHHSLLGRSDSFEFSGEYYRTGDIVEWVDESRRLFRFCNRKNELVNVGGYKINPQEIEEIISQIEGVEQVLVFGKPNSVLGNILCADIKSLQPNCLTDIAIRQHLTSKLPDYKIPRRIRFVESFELTRTGKIKRI
jgi:acyl-coenzyme A synthetase/AMP-(fatty) acid ligase